MCAFMRFSTLALIALLSCAPSLHRPLATGTALSVTGEQAYALYLPRICATKNGRSFSGSRRKGEAPTERGAESKAKALITLAEAHAKAASPERRALSFYNLARALAQLGRKSQALESLSAALDAGDHSPGALAQYPALQPLRQQPGFAPLVTGAR